MGNLPEQRVEWLAESVIPRASLVLLAGEPGSWKTWLALVLARSVATGSLFLGRQCQRADVLCLDRENPAAIVRQRSELLGMLEVANIRIWGGWLEDPPPAIGDFRLAQIARERKPLMIFDPLIRFHSADENSATEMAPIMADLRALANAGATVLLTHHRAKSEASRYRGSSDILAGVDVAYSLSRDAARGLLRLECFKCRFSEEFSMTLRPRIEEGGDFDVTDAPEVARQKTDSETLRRLIEAEPGLPQRELLARSGLPEKRARLLLSRGQGDLWRIEKAAHNSRHYFPLTPGEEAGI